MKPDVGDETRSVTEDGYKRDGGESEREGTIQGGMGDKGCPQTTQTACSLSGRRRSCQRGQKRTIQSQIRKQDQCTCGATVYNEHTPAP